jgi:hypothetical protein
MVAEPGERRAVAACHPPSQLQLLNLVAARALPQLYLGTCTMDCQAKLVRRPRLQRLRCRRVFLPLPVMRNMREAAAPER